MTPFTLTRGGDGSAVLDLQGEVTIEHVRELHGALCADGARLSRLDVRCAELVRLDAAAVQLLYAAGRHAATKTIAGRSDAWTSAFARYGLSDPFEPAS